MLRTSNHHLISLIDELAAPVPTPGVNLTRFEDVFVGAPDRSIEEPAVIKQIPGHLPRKAASKDFNPLLEVDPTQEFTPTDFWYLLVTHFSLSYSFSLVSIVVDWIDLSL